ncbi:uncharacterized protein LOC106011421 [Aplysia californica]|uniref:Globin n=1 Tax=Aplysia californica TaxID=6500 RepID=A0ABM0ZXD7_APLCA|nr:uncharacterized protein LOC106011421 [Aplysia californica]
MGCTFSFPSKQSAKSYRSWQLDEDDMYPPFPSEKEQEEAKEVWEAIKAQGYELELIRVLFSQLFHTFPKSLSLFKSSEGQRLTTFSSNWFDDPRFAEHLKKVTFAINNFVGYLDNEASFQTYATELRTLHARFRGIKKAHYKAMLETLDSAISHVIISEKDTESKVMAWRKLLQYLFTQLTKNLPNTKSRSTTTALDGRRYSETSLASTQELFGDALPHTDALL